MADNKDYQNPFSLLGQEDNQEDDRVNERIHAELNDLLNELGLNLSGNKITVKDPPEKKR